MVAGTLQREPCSLPELPGDENIFTSRAIIALNILKTFSQKYWIDVNNNTHRSHRCQVPSDDKNLLSIYRKSTRLNSLNARIMLSY